MDPLSKKKNRKSVVIHCRKKSSTSNRSQSSFHHVTPAGKYRNQIKNLLKNNKVLAVTLEDTRYELSEKQKLLDNLTQYMSNMKLASFKMMNMHFTLKSFMNDFDEALALLNVDGLNDLPASHKFGRETKKFKAAIETIEETIEHSMSYDKLENGDILGKNVENSLSKLPNSGSTSLVTLSDHTDKLKNIDRNYKNSNEASNQTVSIEVCEKSNKDCGLLENVNENNATDSDINYTSDQLENMATASNSNSNCETELQTIPAISTEECKGAVAVRGERKRNLKAVLQSENPKTPKLNLETPLLPNGNNIKEGKGNSEMISKPTVASILKDQGSKIPRIKSFRAKTKKKTNLSNIFTEKKVSEDAGNSNSQKRKTFCIKTDNNLSKLEPSIILDRMELNSEKTNDSEGPTKTNHNRETFVIKSSDVIENMSSSPSDRRKTFVKKTIVGEIAPTPIENGRDTYLNDARTLLEFNEDCAEGNINFTANDAIGNCSVRNNTSPSTRSKRGTFVVSKSACNISELNEKGSDQNKISCVTQCVITENEVIETCNNEDDKFLLSSLTDNVCTFSQLVGKCSNKTENVDAIKDLNARDDLNSHAEGIPNEEKCFSDEASSKAEFLKDAVTTEEKQTNDLQQNNKTDLLTGESDKCNGKSTVNVSENAHQEADVHYDSVFHSSVSECESFTDLDLDLKSLLHEKPLLKEVPIRGKVTLSAKKFFFNTEKSVSSKDSVCESSTSSETTSVPGQPSTERKNKKVKKVKKALSLQPIEECDDTTAMNNEYSNADKNKEGEECHKAKSKLKKKTGKTCENIGLGKVFIASAEVVSNPTKNVSLDKKTKASNKIPSMDYFDEIEISESKSSLNQSNATCNKFCTPPENLLSVNTNEVDKPDADRMSAIQKTRQSARILLKEVANDDCIVIAEVDKEKNSKKRRNKNENKNCRTREKKSTSKNSNTVKKINKNTFVVQAEIHPIPPSFDMPEKENKNKENECMEGLQNLQVSVVLNDIFQCKSARTEFEEQFVHRGASIPLKSSQVSKDENTTCDVINSVEGPSNRRRRKTVCYREPSLMKKLRR